MRKHAPKMGIIGARNTVPSRNYARFNNCIVPLSCVNFAKCPFNFGEGRESKIVPLPLQSASFVTAVLAQPPPPLHWTVCTNRNCSKQRKMQNQITQIRFPVFLIKVDTSHHRISNAKKFSTSIQCVPPPPCRAQGSRSAVYATFDFPPEGPITSILALCIPQDRPYTERRGKDVDRLKLRGLIGAVCSRLSAQSPLL